MDLDRQLLMRTLVGLLVRARSIGERLLQDPSLTLREIAAEEAVVSAYGSSTTAKEGRPEGPGGRRWPVAFGVEFHSATASRRED